jgi:hypothetical protein
MLPLFSTSVSTPTLDTSHKSWLLAPTVGSTRFGYVRLMMFPSSNKFLPDLRWVLGSLLFITDKFRDLSLQELESPKVTGSGTNRISLIPAQVSLIIKAQLEHGSTESGEVEWDPLRDKAYHHAICQATTNPIYQSPLESDSDCGREVYMIVIEPHQKWGVHRLKIDRVIIDEVRMQQTHIRNI